MWTELGDDVLSHARVPLRPPSSRLWPAAPLGGGGLLVELGIHMQMRSGERGSRASDMGNTHKQTRAN